MTFHLLFWTFMNYVFGKLHLLTLETKLEALPADAVSFEHCILSYHGASCVYSVLLCSFVINVLLLFGISLVLLERVLLHVRSTHNYFIAAKKFENFILINPVE